jgi:hypothetical protein
MHSPHSPQFPPDPLAPSLMEPTFVHYRAGYLDGHADGTRHAAERAEAHAAAFLAYLAEDSESNREAAA